MFHNPYSHHTTFSWKVQFFGMKKSLQFSPVFLAQGQGNPTPESNAPRAVALQVSASWNNWKSRNKKDGKLQSS